MHIYILIMLIFVQLDKQEARLQEHVYDCDQLGWGIGSMNTTLCEQINMEFKNNF